MGLFKLYLVTGHLVFGLQIEWPLIDHLGNIYTFGLGKRLLSARPISTP